MRTPAVPEERKPENDRVNFNDFRWQSTGRLNTWRWFQGTVSEASLDFFLLLFEHLWAWFVVNWNDDVDDDEDNDDDDGDDEGTTDPKQGRIHPDNKFCL